MIKIYRNIAEVEQVSKKNAVHHSAIMGLDEVRISVVTDRVLDIEEGDYILHNGIRYVLNRDAEYEIRGDVNYSYDLIFEHPQYTLINKLLAHSITGSTNFTLTGKLADFVSLLVGSVNVSVQNPTGVDTGWSVGNIIDTEYKTITISDINCRESLKLFAKEFDAEYYFSGTGKTINFVERIENVTSLVFEQGRERGLYKITQRNVDKEDTVTRVYVRGGNQNVPNAYADEEGYLKLPENYLENFSEHSKVVERKMKFEEEFPHFLGSIATVSGENNSILTCPAIDFDIQAIAVGDTARINFLTGDLMGNSFEFSWNNSLKQITLIDKEDETALPDADGVKPTIPSLAKKAKVGDKFNFTGLMMPIEYVNASITRLRAKGLKWLEFYSKKRVKFTIDIDYRWMRDKDQLVVGDLVVISIPQRSFSQVIRITELEYNLHTGAISATVSNYLEESWDKYLKDKITDVRNEILAKQANVRNTLETIFKDGIITETELKSIEVILTNLSVERGQLNAQYLVVRGNNNLTNKTPLEAAWSNYQTAFVEVETAINNAIADKLVSDAEKDNIDNKISIYSTRTNEFATALENAREAIENYKNQGLLDVVDQNKQYLQQQIDGEVSNWFYAYSPTLANYPASDWTTNEIKDRHVGDTFTNTAQAPATDAGKSWRFVKNGSVYSWTLIADSDAVKALLKAAEAQATADGKSTTFLIQPTKYHLGDMWVLNTDQTVNGIAYKQGEILTATQDSTTFNEAHWLKRIRYTDDTAIDNLEIGGRNLLIGSTDAWKTVNAYSYNPYIDVPFNETKLEAGQTYVFSWETELLSGSPTTATQVVLGAGVTSYQRDIIWTARRIIGKQFRVFTPTEADLSLGDSFILRWYTNNEVFSFRYRKLKLEKGNKPSADWTPAPEDVQAEINTAKQEALTAAGNAQTTANSLKDFTDTAFRDGIIDRSESVAIEKYKNSLNETMSKAEASYNKVYTNTYLEGTAKTSLLNAKVNLWGQRDTLLSAINTAISGGTTTPAQKTSVDNAFSTFNNLMTSFQNALEEANKAIQTKLDDLSTEKVNNIQIGGRNLFSVNDFVADNKARGYSTINVINYNGNIAYRSSNIVNNHNVPRYLQGKFEANTQYYFKFNILWESYTNSGAQYVFQIRYTDGTLSNFYATTSQTYRAFLTTANKTIDYITTTRQHDGTVVIYNIQLEKGNKPTDWTPAIEDVQYDINKAMADANLARAITDKFGTTINNGLVATVILLLRELNSQQDTAGLSGIQGASRNQPSYWSGGNYAKAQAFVPFVVKLENEQSTSLAEYNNLPKIVFLHSGAAKVGHFIVLTSGEILIVDPSTGSVKLKFTTAELPSITDLVAGTNSQGSTAVGAGVASISSSQVVSGSTQVSKNGAIATFNGTHISLSARGIAQAGGMASFAEAVLYARQNGVRVQRLASVAVHFTNTVYEDKSAEVLPVPFSFPLDAGTYTFELVIHTTGTISSGNAVTSASNLSWKHTVAGVKKQQYSKDGMMFFYSNRHFYFNELTGLDVKESDSSKFNMPGVLLSASVPSTGGFSNWWGAKKHASSTATKSSAGTYIVYHSVGHTNYQVNIVPHSNRVCYVGTKTASQFTVYFYTNASSPSLSDTGFDFQIFGNNYNT